MSNQERSKNPKQLDLLKKQSKAHGGILRNKRSGRGQRPISTKYSMHLVLRSSLATGPWSFKAHNNDQKIKNIVKKFATKYGVKVISLANVGNHLHFHIQLMNRHTYKAFIRALTSAIAMAITGLSRWNKDVLSSKTNKVGQKAKKFWDYRPYTSVITAFKQLMNLKDYIKINQIEGFGFTKQEARWIFHNDHSWNLNPRLIRS